MDDNSKEDDLTNWTYLVSTFDDDAQLSTGSPVVPEVETQHHAFASTHGLPRHLPGQSSMGNVDPNTFLEDFDDRKPAAVSLVTQTGIGPLGGFATDSSTARYSAPLTNWGIQNRAESLSAMDQPTNRDASIQMAHYPVQASGFAAMPMHERTFGARQLLPGSIGNAPTQFFPAAYQQSPYATWDQQHSSPHPPPLSTHLGQMQQTYLDALSQPLRMEREEQGTLPYGIGGAFNIHRLPGDTQTLSNVAPNQWSMASVPGSFGSYSSTGFGSEQHRQIDPGFVSGLSSIIPSGFGDLSERMSTIAPSSMAEASATSSVPVSAPSISPSALAGKTKPRPRKKASTRKVKGNAPSLLKPMSAYNYYFRDERYNIIRWKGEGLPPPVSDWSEERQRSLLYEHWFNDPIKGRRLHRKTESKLGFTELSTVISQRWRDLSPLGREFYQRLALLDCQRYQNELKEQESSTTTEQQPPPEDQHREEEDAQQQEQKLGTEESTSVERTLFGRLDEMKQEHIHEYNDDDDRGTTGDDDIDSHE